MSDFTKLENIFRMFSNFEELAAEKIDKVSSSNSTSLTRQLIRILIESGLGAHDVQGLLKKIKQLSSNVIKENNEQQKLFERLITLYTSEPGSGGRINAHALENEDLNFTNIAGLNEGDLGDKNFSFCLSRSAYVSPMLRDVSKVETFLNYLPPTVLSMCMPYLELEFVFDRPDSDAWKLASPSLLKFLIGGSELSDHASADHVMYEANYQSANEMGASGSIPRTYVAAGMELFTSPQTLLNMDPVGSQARYMPVIDPTRPLATLESVTINVKGTTGIMSFKTGQATIKIHDRSRLSEFADVLQPGAESRVTVWLTYGWRYMVNPDTKQLESTYGDFINKNLLIKEAYGITNSSFSFDTSGQVSVTLELYTKSGSELKSVTTVDEDRIKVIRVKQSNLAASISRYREKLKLDPPEGSKEILGYTLIEAASSNTFPDLTPTKVSNAIDSLGSSLKKIKDNQALTNDITQLIKLLKQYYLPAKGAKFSYKEEISKAANKIMQEKIKQLYGGVDPFLITESRWEKVKSNYNDVPHPHLEEIKKFRTEAPIKKDQLVLTQESQNKGIYIREAVSFGKLFCTFMVPAFLANQTINDFQIYFYNLNELAGKAASTNIAEFPIDLYMFLAQYKEVIETNATTVMTVEQFIKLAVDSQISDIRAIPYGFRSAGIFKPFDPKNKELSYKKEADEAQLTVLSTQVNSGRGAFQIPQIEVLVEVKNKNSTDDEKPSDLLNVFSNQGALKDLKTSSKDQVLLIHVFDKTMNPFVEEAKILKSSDSKRYGYQRISDPWVDLMRSNSGASTNNASIDKQVSQNGFESYVALKGDSTDRGKVIREYVAKRVPTLIPGSNASAIFDASVSTKNDPTLKAAQMLGMNIGRNLQGTPRGAGIGNLPLRVSPTTLSMKTIGCPLISYAQMFFVDLNTGTSVDNIYGVTNMTHTLGQGRFETQLELTLYDAYAKFESAEHDSQLDETVKAVENTVQGGSSTSIA